MSPSYTTISKYHIEHLSRVVWVRETVNRHLELIEQVKARMFLILDNFMTQNQPESMDRKQSEYRFCPAIVYGPSTPSGGLCGSSSSSGAPSEHYNTHTGLIQTLDSHNKQTYLNGKVQEGLLQTDSRQTHVVGCLTDTKATRW